MKIQEILEAFDPYANHDPMNKRNKKVGVVNDAAHMAEIIKANCGSMVTAYQNSNERLLRGMNGGHTDAIITAIRPDRKPLYMGEESHKILQQAFTDLGLTANRTNSIFCTTAIDTAEDWGEVYAIFVKDGWEGTVFSKVGKGYAFNKLEVYADEYLDDGDYYKLVDAIQKLQPTIIRNSSDLTTVLNSRYEDILITGDSYIGLEYHSKLYDEVDKLLNLKNYT